MGAKPVTKGECNVRGNDSANSCWYANWSKFCKVIDVFVEAKKVGVRKEFSGGLGYSSLVNKIEECVDVRVDVFVVHGNKRGEGVDGIGIDAGAFVASCMSNGIADVAWEDVFLDGLLWRLVVARWDRF